MRQTLKVFSIGMHAMRRDAVMLILIPAPFFIGALFRFLVPLLNGLLAAQAGISLTPWYPLVDALLCALTPLMPTVASAFLLLEECDEGIGRYYSVTPGGRLPYLAARVGIPALWGFVCGAVVLPLFGLAPRPFPVILAAALVAALNGAATAMMIVALAANRVEGLAVSKLCGIALLGLAVAWLVPGPWRWTATFLPSFWLGEVLLGKPLLPSLAAGAVASLCWAAVFARRFAQKVS